MLKKTVKNRKIIENIPNICSISNACCGILAILITIQHKDKITVNIACIFIVFGGFLDFIDGKIARKFDVMSEIGKQLDSFADLITFAVAPICVFLSMHCEYRHIHIVEVLIATFYVACAMYRLARYNVTDCKGYFEGLPTTACGAIMSVYIFTSNMLVDKWINNGVYTLFSFIFICILGFLMISKFRVNRM